MRIQSKSIQYLYDTIILQQFSLIRASTTLCAPNMTNPRLLTKIRTFFCCINDLYNESILFNY